VRDPAFWWIEHSDLAALLAPVGACYGVFVARHMARPGRKAPVPVICIGNFTLGGAGKTPTAIAFARILLESGRRPFFLSRGYGGRVAGPVRIDSPHPTLHPWERERPARTLEDAGGTPALPGGREGWGDVGDEPLLLARVAPTIVARDRPAGAKAAAEGGADTIIMDDGLQNPSLDKDLAIAVVDGRRGIGNGRVFPAGPLRAPLEAQFDHIHAVLLVGSASPAAERAVDAAQRRGVPVFRGDLHPAPDVVAALVGKPVLAFAGIADPDKFFATLETHGIPATVRKPFPDHHRYAAEDISALVACAGRNGLRLVTTEKDMARLRGDPAAIDLIERSAVLPVTLTFREETAVRTIVSNALSLPAVGKTPSTFSPQAGEEITTPPFSQ
jgi:tetraacyldisaccharide 4'-kinase